MSQEFITIKVWKSTRQKAKILAAEQDVSLAALMDKAIDFISDVVESEEYEFRQNKIDERMSSEFGPGWQFLKSDKVLPRLTEIMHEES